MCAKIFGPQGTSMYTILSYDYKMCNLFKIKITGA